MSRKTKHLIRRLRARAFASLFATEAKSNPSVDPDTVKVKETPTEYYVRAKRRLGGGLSRLMTVRKSGNMLDVPIYETPIWEDIKKRRSQPKKRRRKQVAKSLFFRPDPYAVLASTPISYRFSSHKANEATSHARKQRNRERKNDGLR